MNIQLFHIQLFLRIRKLAVVCMLLYSTHLHIKGTYILDADAVHLEAKREKSEEAACLVHQ